jgi:hypothetical protein
MRETQSKLWISVAPAPKEAEANWEAFGIAMSGDPRVVAVPYKREYSRILAEQHSFYNEWILLYANRSLSEWGVDEIAETYGKPEKEKKTRMLSGQFSVRPLTAGLGMQDRTVMIRYYGSLGLVTEPDEKAVIGICVRLPKREE